MSTPRPPKDLAARGRALWRHAVTTFDPTPADLVLLLELARTVDLCERVAAELASQPLMIAGSRGQLRPNPLLGELRQLRDLQARLAARLGMDDDDGATSSSNRFRFAQAGARARWGYTRPKVVGGSR